MLIEFVKKFDFSNFCAIFCYFDLLNHELFKFLSNQKVKNIENIPEKNHQKYLKNIPKCSQIIFFNKIKSWSNIEWHWTTLKAINQLHMTHLLNVDEWNLLFNTKKNSKNTKVLVIWKFLFADWFASVSNVPHRACL